MPSSPVSDLETMIMTHILYDIGRVVGVLFLELGLDRFDDIVRRCLFMRRVGVSETSVCCIEGFDFNQFTVIGLCRD